jgi:hypothetical protein
MGSITPHGFSSSISDKRNLAEATKQARPTPNGTFSEAT